MLSKAKLFLLVLCVFVQSFHPQNVERFFDVVGAEPFCRVVMRGRIEKAAFRGTKETREEIKAAGREKSGVESRETDEARIEREIDGV